MKKYGVFLSRFSPIHKGHQTIIDKIISLHGIDNIILLIGSSNSLDERTPYTLNTRINMIKTIYPDLKVISLPDSSKNIKRFTEKGNKIWLQKIKNLENKLHAEFIFYGGSTKDLEILNRKFITEDIVDRSKLNISGTSVRKLLADKKYKLLDKYLDRIIIPQAIRGFKKY